MCGIAAYKGSSKCLPILKKMLQKLEYRGYDSCGVSYIINDQLLTLKNVGCVKDLVNNYLDLESETNIGIAHTRWATHGHPSVRNSHPHSTLDGRLSIVHNGIVENYKELKVELETKGYYFLSDTDSEVLLYLIYDNLITIKECDILSATKLALKKVLGAYAIVILDKSNPRTLVAARKGSPLVVGEGNDSEEYYVASDSGVLADFTNKIYHLEDSSIVVLDSKISSYSLKDDSELSVKLSEIDCESYNINKGCFNHFMLKEIYEQSQTIKNCFSGRLDSYKVKLGGLEDHKDNLSNINSITILACGSSYYAGLVGKYYFEEFCGIKTTVEIAGEFLYRKPVVGSGDVVIAISQSGETSDVLRCVEFVKNKGAFIVGVCNVADSSLTRLTDCGVFCRAGMEVGVASTKTFSSQLVVLLLMALWIDSNNKNVLVNEHRNALIQDLKKLPDHIDGILNMNLSIKNWANKYYKTKRFLFIGREYNYPIALESALKLKEVAYCNSEGYAASELKHGPLSLVDKDTLVIAISNNSKQYSKMSNSISEVTARNGKVLEICNHKKGNKNCSLTVPEVTDALSPILSVVVLQLFSYYCAILKGYDPDKPKNLAKSVTVE